MARKVEAEIEEGKTSEKNRYSAEAEGPYGGEMHLPFFSQCHLFSIINLLGFFLLVSGYL